MDEIVDGTLAVRRFLTVVLSAFSFAALILASFGSYGVMAHSVRQRTHEIGVRMALGARRGDILKLVIKKGLTLIVVGLVIGVVGVSNLLRWLLRRFEKATLGALLGLLLGAVVGLWPFQQAEPPEPGDVIGSRTVTLENAASFDPEDWPLHRFDPEARHWLGALALIGCGLLATTLIGRLGSGAPEASHTPPDAHA